MPVNLAGLVDHLRKIAGRDAVLDRPEDLMLYEYDAGIRKCTPGAVVFPQKTEQVSQIMRLATAENIAVVARGAGTGLSGGSIPQEGGIVIAFSRMNRILEVERREPARRGAAGRGESATVRSTSRTLGCTSRPILPARKLAPSVATSPKTPAGRTP